MLAEKYRFVNRLVIRARISRAYSLSSQLVEKLDAGVLVGNHVYLEGFFGSDPLEIEMFFRV